MLFSSDALKAYRTSNYDRALEIAASVIETDPNSAEAHLCLGLVQRRRGNMRGAIANFKRSAALRSGEWLVEQLRGDQSRQPLASTTLEDAMALGNLLRSGLNPVGPALAVEYHKAGGQCVNVIGTSLVRSFGGNACFFPLFIGMGPTTNVLTEHTLAVARRKYVENLTRLDTRRDTIIVLGADIYYHVLDQLGTRSHRGAHITAEDWELVSLLAERYRLLLNDVKPIVGGRLLLLGQTPTYNVMMNELSLELNRRLVPICEDLGVVLLDWWEDMAEEGTNLLRADLSANAFPEDIHFSLSATGLFVDKLRALGVFDDRVKSIQDFEWSHVFECEIEPSEKTRIWPEPSVSPNNAFRSQKIAASHLSGRLADLMAALLTLQESPSVLFVNCRDAWLPANIPPQVGSSVVAMTDTLENLWLGQMILDFYGRSDVALMLHNGEALHRLQGLEFSFWVLCLYPGSYEVDLERAKQAMQNLRRPQHVVLITPFPDRLNEFSGLGYGSVVVSKIGHRHVPTEWHETTVAMLM
jgi:hypothetical protein